VLPSSPGVSKSGQKREVSVPTPDGLLCKIRKDIRGEPSPLRLSRGHSLHHRERDDRCWV